MAAGRSSPEEAVEALAGVAGEATGRRAGALGAPLRRPVAGVTVAVAYTCAAEQYPSWRHRFTGWLVAPS